MKNWWREGLHVPNFVNFLKDGQKKAACASLPISDEWLTFISTNSILAENSFPATREKWDKLPSAEKKWAKWKAQAGGGSFRSTNTATTFHEISAPDPANEKVPSSTVKNIDGYLDNIAAAATKKRDALNLLVANNKRLNTTMSHQHTTPEYNL